MAEKFRALSSVEASPLYLPRFDAGAWEFDTPADRTNCQEVTKSDYLGDGITDNNGYAFI
jgi:hypothetical protein